MRRDPEFFSDRELELLFIGKRLRQSQDVERVLDTAGIDYAIEVDQYVGGVIFRSTRAGAFFYVLPEAYDHAAGVLQQAGFAAQPREGNPT